MARRRPRCHGLALAVLLTCTSTAALAKPPEGVLLQLKRMGGGPARRTVRSVHVVDASTGEVLLTSKIGARGKLVLTPPSAPAFAVASVATPKGLRTGVSNVFRFAPGTRLKLKVPLQRPSGGVPQSHRISTVTFVASGGVATMGAVTITGPNGVTVPITDPL